MLMRFTLPCFKERCERDGLGTSEEVLARQFRLHLHRGIGYLASPQTIRAIGDLIRLAGEESGAQFLMNQVGFLRCWL